jgi:predicted RNA binding protein YcfA (HicA-like mRNA interferase family)
MKLPTLSGAEVLKILTKHFSFEAISQRGSHVKIRKGNITSIVPIHPELAKGTLLEILEECKISKEDFLRYA